MSSGSFFQKKEKRERERERETKLSRNSPNPPKAGWVVPAAAGAPKAEGAADEGVAAGAAPKAGVVEATKVFFVLFLESGSRSKSVRERIDGERGIQSMLEKRNKPKAGPSQTLSSSSIHLSTSSMTEVKLPEHQKKEEKTRTCSKGEAGAAAAKGHCSRLNDFSIGPTGKGKPSRGSLPLSLVLSFDVRASARGASNAASGERRERRVSR